MHCGEYDPEPLVTCHANTGLSGAARSGLWYTPRTNSILPSGGRMSMRFPISSAGHLCTICVVTCGCWQFVGARLQSNSPTILPNRRPSSVDDSRGPNTVQCVQTTPGYPIEPRRRWHRGGGGGDHRGGFQILSLRPRTMPPHRGRPAPARSAGRFRCLHGGALGEVVAKSKSETEKKATAPMQFEPGVCRP
jgi:hypothetical protein